MCLCTFVQFVKFVKFCISLICILFTGGLIDLFIDCKYFTLKWLSLRRRGLSTWAIIDPFSYFFFCVWRGWRVSCCLRF